jgi:hypothetical protein
MYIFLEYITYVALVIGALAALFAACVASLVLESGIETAVRAFCKSGVHLSPRPFLAALKLDTPLFKDGNSLVPVKVHSAEDDSVLSR